jgi:hypothetical protein
MAENEKSPTPIDLSSVVVRGIDAITFNEMEAFVKDLESRPMERLLRDLPQLAQMSSNKVSLVSYVVAAKYRASDPLEKQAMRESVAATYESLPAGDSRKLIGEILDRLR